MIFFLFFIAALATYRLALMFSKESGPGRIFQKLRRQPPPKSSAREGLSCPFCMSIWFAAVITVIYVALGVVSLSISPIYALALSACAVCLNQMFTLGEL